MNIALFCSDLIDVCQNSAGMLMSKKLHPPLSRRMQGLTSYSRPPEIQISVRNICRHNKNESHETWNRFRILSFLYTKMLQNINNMQRYTILV